MHYAQYQQFTKFKGVEWSLGFLIWVYIQIKSRASVIPKRGL